MFNSVPSYCVITFRFFSALSFSSNFSFMTEHRFSSNFVYLLNRFKIPSWTVILLSLPPCLLNKFSVCFGFFSLSSKSSEMNCNKINRWIRNTNVHIDFLRFVAEKTGFGFSSYEFRLQEMQTFKCELLYSDFLHFLRILNKTRINFSIDTNSAYESLTREDKVNVWCIQEKQLQKPKTISIKLNIEDETSPFRKNFIDF